MLLGFSNGTIWTSEIKPFDFWLTKLILCDTKGIHCFHYDKAIWNLIFNAKKPPKGPTCFQSGVNQFPHEILRNNVPYSPNQCLASRHVILTPQMAVRYSIVITF